MQAQPSLSLLSPTEPHMPIYHSGGHVVPFACNGPGFLAQAWFTPVVTASLLIASWFGMKNPRAPLDRSQAQGLPPHHAVMSQAHSVQLGSLRTCMVPREQQPLCRPRSSRQPLQSSQHYPVCRVHISALLPFAFREGRRGSRAGQSPVEPGAKLTGPEG